MTPHDLAMQKAKIQLMSSPGATFFMAVCFSMRHVWNPEIPTARTNGITVEYSPEFFLSLNQSERVFLMLHETLHACYTHMARLGNRCPKKWNVATDHVINIQLSDRNFQMPAGGLLDTDYRGMSAEQIYAVLPDDTPTPAIFDLDPEGQPEPSNDPTKSDDGELQRQVDSILIRAAIQSRMAGDAPGSIPGDIQIHLDELLNPKLPWNRLLIRYMKKFARNDYSYRRFNKRYLPQFYLPTLYSESLSDLVIAIDSSGSVTDDEFKRFVSEVFGIMRMMKPEKITLLQFDTKIRSVDVIRHEKDFHNILFSGRGGTRIGPVLKWAEEHKPEAMLIFSDGEFNFPEHIPVNVDLLWLIHHNPNFTAPHGKVIHYET